MNGTQPEAKRLAYESSSSAAYSSSSQGLKAKGKKKTTSEEGRNLYQSRLNVQNEIDNKFIARSVAALAESSHDPFKGVLPNEALPCRSVYSGKNKHHFCKKKLIFFLFLTKTCIGIEKSFADSGAQSIQLLLNSNEVSKRHIGCLCQVFWEGDGLWFYGRILNYCPALDKYFVFYLDDNTAEWISSTSDPIIIATDFVTIKGWPALKYSTNEAALPALKKKKKYCKSAYYVEYLNDHEQRIYEFVALNSIQPFEPHLKRSIKLSKKMLTALGIATAEFETFQGVLASVVAFVKKAFFYYMQGKHLIGYRITLKTSPSVTTSSSSSSRQSSSSSLPQRARVVDYSPGMQQYFLVFEKPSERPAQWMPITEESIDVDLNTPPLTASELASRIPDEAACQLCGGEEKRLTMEQCSTCGLRYHSSCLPSSYLTNSPSSSSSTLSSADHHHRHHNKSYCWKCTCCEGCGISAWEAPYCVWNLKWIDEQAPDHPIGFCGNCLYRFKYSKDFCPVCFKLYPPEEAEPSLPVAAAPLHGSVSTNIPAGSQEEGLNAPVKGLQEDMDNGEAMAMDSFGDNLVMVKKEPTEDKEASQGVEEGKVVEEEMNHESMVQCNDCCRWVHSICEGIDQAQYEAMTKGIHPVWGDEYLCPGCRIGIPSQVIQHLSEEDELGIFAEPVTEAMAENYFDVIRSPMDLQTMAIKAQKGQYKSMQILRQDFELMCLNALVFNKMGDEYFLSSMHFFDKVQDYFVNMTRQTNITAFGVEASSIVASYREAYRDSRKVVIDHQAEIEQREKVKLAEEKIAMRAARMALRDKKPGEVDTISTAINSTSSSSSTESLLPSVMLPSQTSEDACIGAASSHTSSVGKDSEETVVILPLALSPDPHPSSAFPCAAYSLSIEHALFLSCTEACLVCGASSPDDLLLFCIDCGEAYHSFCVDAPITTMNQTAKLTWRCTNCKICEVCGSATIEDEATLVYCEACDKAFHFFCVEPKIYKLPEGSWFCASCMDCRGVNHMPCVSIGSESGSCWGTATNLWY